ncbi:aldose epimerase [Mangrovicella endophytica]|uniref:aldose epimerase family protein n=1 Tax=Mangrovicella endophytica TaxID=2066697 RepID=UPI000C9E8391|nr:aldose epimerase [Mangrovicella endophytica]
MTVEPDEAIGLASEGWCAFVSARGAELRALIAPDGRSFLWNGDPAWWDGRAPLLFPVIGRSVNDAVNVGGTAYAMPLHGFARTMLFERAAVSPSAATFLLRDSEETRRSFPFAFELDVTYRIAPGALALEAAMRNRGCVPMPASLGFHPGFPWPLPGGEGLPHRIRMIDAALAPVRMGVDANGLLTGAEQPSPFRCGRLQLEPQLFAERALVFPGGVGSRLVYETSDGSSFVEMIVDGFPHLAIWSRPDAPFVCIEPWLGLPAFAGDDGALEGRRSGAIIPPSDSVRCACTIRFGRR